MKKEIFKISGMHCASCANKIEKAVSHIAGVASAQVNFASESLLAEFDETKTSPQNMAEAVSDLGYKLLVPQSQHAGHAGHAAHAPATAEHKLSIDNGDISEDKEFLSLKVLGMESSHCAMIVEKAIKTLPGIEKRRGFSNERAKIVLIRKTNSEQIKQAITDGLRTDFGNIRNAGCLEQEKNEREKN